MLERGACLLAGVDLSVVEEEEEEEEEEELLEEDELDDSEEDSLGYNLSSFLAILSSFLGILTFNRFASSVFGGRSTSSFLGFGTSVAPSFSFGFSLLVAVGAGGRGGRDVTLPPPSISRGMGL